MTAKAEQTEVKGGPKARTLLAHSMLEGPIQVILVGEILDRADAVLSGSSIPNFYVAFSKKNYDGAVNGAFDFGVLRKNLEKADRTIEGPFDRKLGCTFAYLRQEATVLQNSEGSEELDAELDKIGAFSARAIGQGLSKFVERLVTLKRMQPSLSAEELIKTAVEGQQPVLVDEINACRQRHLKAQMEEDEEQTSIASRELRMAEDRLMGFDEGALLARELLALPWTRTKFIVNNPSASSFEQVHA